MRRIDLLAEYRAQLWAEAAPKRAAVAIILTGVLALVGYGVYAYRQMGRAQALINNTETTKQQVDVLKQQVTAAENALQTQRDAFTQKQDRIRSDQQILATQVSATRQVQTHAASTLVKIAEWLPKTARLTQVEFDTKTLRLEGYGMSATEIMKTIARLTADGLEVRLERLVTRRRRGEEHLFYRVAVSQRPRVTPEETEPR